MQLILEKHNTHIFFLKFIHGLDFLRDLPSSSLFFSCVGGALSTDALFCDTDKSTPLPRKSAKMECSAGTVLARTFRGREGHKRLFRHQTYWHDVSSDHAIGRCRAPQACLSQTLANAQGTNYPTVYSILQVQNLCWRSIKREGAMLQTRNNWI